MEQYGFILAIVVILLLAWIFFPGYFNKKVSGLIYPIKNKLVEKSSDKSKLGDTLSKVFVWIAILVALGLMWYIITICFPYGTRIFLDSGFFWINLIVFVLGMFLWKKKRERLGSIAVIVALAFSIAIISSGLKQERIAKENQEKLKQEAERRSKPQIEEKTVTLFEKGDYEDVYLGGKEGLAFVDYHIISGGKVELIRPNNQNKKKLIPGKNIKIYHEPGNHTLVAKDDGKTVVRMIIYYNGK